MQERSSRNFDAINSYMQTMTASGDVSAAMGTTAYLLKLTVFLVMVAGGLALAIWVFRLAADILALALPAGKASERIGKLGTGRSQDYDSVMAYLKDNAVNTILMIVLIAFLVTGYLFQIVGMAMTGFGLLINKLVGIDVEEVLMEFSVQDYETQVMLMTPAQVKAEYDQAVAGMRSEAQMIHSIGAQNSYDINNDQLRQHLRQYALHFQKADAIGGSSASGTSGGAVDRNNYPNLEDGYFGAHRTGGRNGVCVEGFFSHSFIQDEMGSSGVSCNARNS